MDVFFVSASVFLFGFPRAFFCMHGQVIHIDGEPSLSYLFSEYSVHHHLESCWGVGKPEEHNCWFEESLGSEEGCFWFVTWFDAYVVIPPSTFQMCKEGTSAQTVDCLGN